MSSEPTKKPRRANDAVEVVRKGTNSKRMKRMCEYYSKSFVLGTAATPPLRQKRRAVALCALLALQPPNEPPSLLLLGVAGLALRRRRA